MTQPSEIEPTARDALEYGRWVRQTVSAWEGRLVRYASRITGDVERARDVVQETFLRLLREDRDQVESRLAEWLFTVCRNVALDVRGKERRMQPLHAGQARLEVCSAPTPAVAAENAEALVAVLGMVDRLPDNQQEVLRLKFQEGLSYKEISHVTRHSVSHVGVLLHHALKTLRTSIPSGSDLAPHA